MTEKSLPGDHSSPGGDRPVEAPEAAAPPPAETARAVEPGPADPTTDRAEPPVEAVAAAPVEADPLAGALSALDRRDYATAKRLFEAVGRKDAAEAIDSALSALDRKDYAAAQGLFEALAPPRIAPPAAAAAPETAAAATTKAEDPPKAAPVEPVPVVAPSDRPPAAAVEKRRARPLLIAAGLAALALLGGSAFYAARHGTGPALAVDLVKATFKPIFEPVDRSSARADTDAAALGALAARLDRIEQDYGARLDKLGESLDPNAAAKSADVSTRLEALEKKAAQPAEGTSPASDPRLAAFEARLDQLEKKPAPPPQGLAEVTARLERLERRAAASAANVEKPLPPVAPKRSRLAAQAQGGGAAARGGEARYLQDYSVEDVQNGVAVVDGRYGSQQVAPGDFIPGAGRVISIERRGGDWYVLTSNGVIAAGPPY